MTRDDRTDSWEPVPIREDVSPAVIRYAPDVVERCYQLWAWRCARSPRAVERTYRDEVPEGTPVPTYTTIRDWAIRDHWDTRRRDDFARNCGDNLYDMQVDAATNIRRQLDIVAEIQAGLFDHDPAAALVRLKAGELAVKLVERGIVPLMPKPIEPEANTDGMTREEREAKAMAAATMRKRA